MIDDHGPDQSFMLAFAIVSLIEAGVATDAPFTAETFAAATRDLPAGLVIDDAILVATALVIDYFDDDVTDTLHGGLLADEARGRVAPFEAMHTACSLIAAELDEYDDKRKELLTAHPLRELARGCVAVTGLLARVAADQEGVTVRKILAALCDGPL